jgi:hypothetical protein
MTKIDFKFLIFKTAMIQIYLVKKNKCNEREALNSMIPDKKDVIRILEINYI